MGKPRLLSHSKLAKKLAGRKQAFDTAEGRVQARMALARRSARVGELMEELSGRSGKKKAYEREARSIAKKAGDWKVEQKRTQSEIIELLHYAMKRKERLSEKTQYWLARANKHIVVHNVTQGIIYGPKGNIWPTQLYHQLMNRIYTKRKALRASKAGKFDAIIQSPEFAQFVKQLNEPPKNAPQAPAP